MAAKTTSFKYSFGGGQFEPDLPGQFAPDSGGQLRPDRGGHIERIFQHTATVCNTQLQLAKMSIQSPGRELVQ